MRIVWNTLAALALSGVVSFAQADADPKLQALLDQRGN